MRSLNVFAQYKIFLLLITSAIALSPVPKSPLPSYISMASPLLPKPTNALLDAADALIIAALVNCSQPELGEPQDGDDSDYALAFKSQETFVDHNPSPSTEAALANANSQFSLHDKMIPDRIVGLMERLSPQPLDEWSNTYGERDEPDSSHRVEYPFRRPDATDWLDELVDALKRRGITNLVMYIQGMHAQRRHAFTDLIRERFKRARDENQMDDLLQRMSIGVERAFVGDFRARIERELDLNKTCDGDSVGGEHQADAALSGRGMNPGEQGSPPSEDRSLPETPSIRSHAAQLSIDASARDCDRQLSRLERKGTTAKTRFYAKKIAKRARVGDNSHSISTISKRHRVDSDDHGHSQPPPKRHKSKECVIGIDYNDRVFRDVSPPASDSYSEPSPPHQLSQAQSQEQFDNRPLRRQSAMPRINTTGQSNVEGWCSQPLRRETDRVVVSPSGTPESQKYHHLVYVQRKKFDYVSMGT